MQQISDIFIAEADNFENTINSHGGNVGFRVPEYQRTYDWNKENIKRLLEDCLNGFYYLSNPKNEESYTFLGTLILVSEKSEPSFDGTSLSVVDGQQRLTTLILICCALIEELFLREEDIHHLQKPTISWIKREIEFIHERLFDCVRGQLSKRGQMACFPRVVRLSEDNRGFSRSEAEYRSVSAKFLMDFAAHYSQSNSVFVSREEKNNAEEGRFFQNYKYIQEQVELGIYKSDDAPDAERQGDLEHNQVGHEDFQKAGLRNLFEKLDTLPDEREKNRAISDVANNSDSSGLIRIILFSHYVLKSIILTRVETNDEDAAFDIFDSLNTTGEPLTAIETFKSRVMSFERANKNLNFSGTESARHFERLEENLNDIYPETSKRQKETKDLLVTFALYFDGHKLPLSLASQRTYLRSRFDKTANSNLKRQMVQGLADIAEFRQTYWNRDSIRTLDSIHHNTSDWLKLCCTFISEMKTSLALPIMARYWRQYKEDKIEDTFADAVKALTAFLVLRRSVTGTTGGIDTDFKQMMVKLCTGLDDSNPLPSLDELKETLRGYLAAKRIGVENKETWVSKSCEVALANRARPLCRFLLFAASDNAMTDQKNPGLLTRDKVIHSDQLAFLNFSKWQDGKYATVEHVAPDSNSAGGWDEEIYRRPHTRHTIGNIILLPQKENSSVGNASWAKKKLFYRALVAKTELDRNEQFEQAKKEGLSFKKQTTSLLKEQGRLDMLDPIAEVPEWTESIIQKRSKNILELAWDVITPWLGY